MAASLQFVPEEIAAHFDQWKKDAAAAGVPFKYYCGVDVGGTNTRVALCPSTSAQYIVVPKFLTLSTRTLLANLVTLSDAIVAIAGQPCSGSCLDLAGPITQSGTRVVITNVDASQGPEHLLLERDELPEGLFPHSRTIFLNDLESACYGVITVSEQGALGQFFERLWAPPSVSADAPIALGPSHCLVAAMGTGLGIGLITYTPSPTDPTRGVYGVLPLEGGHSLAYPPGPAHSSYTRHMSTLTFLSEKLYEGKSWPEWEDACSGRGLSWIYEHLSATIGKGKETLTAARVAEGALGEVPDLVAVEAMKIHYELLLRACQNLCLCTQAKGLVLMGDNQVNNRTFVNGYKEALEETFNANGHPEWTKAVSVLQQTTSVNINLQGCVYVAKVLGARADALGQSK